jgi:carbonic anhydrase/acetyltransferase-like protein (isoleucine patch superfamily)
MTKTKNKKSMKSLYVLGFPINLFLELFIQFTSLIIPVTLLRKSLQESNILIATTVILLGLYIYPLTILFLSAIITRLLPKPRLGKIETQKDALKYQTLIALNTFVRRTPARWLLIFPFPGYLFYKISGTKIDSSALITSPDSLQDVYLVSIGKNSLLGWGCLVLGHYSGDGSTTFLGEVKIGNNVLIGEGATVWANVRIGDRAIVQNKSVVMPDTIIPPDEIWGGVPARKIKSIKENEGSSKSSFVSPDELEIYLLELLKNNYGIQELNRDAPLLSLNLTATDVTHILRLLEKRYKISINRTRINITIFSFNEMISITEKEIKQKRLL